MWCAQTASAQIGAGDLFYTDGTVSSLSERDTGKTLLGVIGYVSEDKRTALLVAPKDLEEKYAYGKSNALTSLAECAKYYDVIKDTCGVANTSVIAESYTESYAATAASAFSVEAESGWYLGSAGEWELVLQSLGSAGEPSGDANWPYYPADVWANANTALEAAGVESFKPIDCVYWTSTQVNKSFAATVEFSSEGKSSIYRELKTEEHYVRPFLRVALPIVATEPADTASSVVTEPEPEEPEPEEPWEPTYVAQVGFAYYADGSYAPSSELMESKTLLGVIGYVSEDKRTALLVAPKDLEEKYEWGESNLNELTVYEKHRTAITDTAGWSHTQIIADAFGSSAASAANAYSVAGETGWHLPSAGEWELVLQNLGNALCEALLTQPWPYYSSDMRENMDSAMQAVKANGFSTIENNCVYWTSSQTKDDYAITIEFSEKGDNCLYKEKVTVEQLVRPFLRVALPEIEDNTIVTHLGSISADESHDAVIFTLGGQRISKSAARGKLVIVNGKLMYVKQ